MNPTMNIKSCRCAFSALLLSAALFLSAAQLHAVNYNGNGSSDWGGSVGGGTLSVTDDGTTITFTLTRGVSGNLDNALVVYIDSVSGGFADTSTLGDTADGGRKAISGYNGGTQRSTMTFASGFAPDYAVVIQGGFASLFQLVSGGANSLVWITGTAQGGNGSPSFSLSFPASAIGLTPNVQSPIKIFGTLISDSGYRSSEAIAGNDTGTDGWNPFTQTSFSSYNFAVPVITTYPVTFSVDMTVQIASGAFNPGAGDTVSAVGTFQTNVWVPGSFVLQPSGGNPNIYTGTYHVGDPLATVELYKFSINTNGGGVNYEYTDNRSFTLASGGMNLPVVYFADITPSSGIPTQPLTFQVDISAQVAAGIFNSGDKVEVWGTFQTPTPWSEGLLLTNSPSGPNPNLYSGTFHDGNYAGTYEQYNFALVGTTYTYLESIPHRTFTAGSSGQTFPAVYFNNVSNVYTVVFSVDMSLAPNFTPTDTVSVRGGFQAPATWTGGFNLANTPANPYVFSGSYKVAHPRGSREEYKFTWTDTSSTAHWEDAIGNRVFFLTNVVLPLAVWENRDTNDIMALDTQVTFRVDMASAVGHDPDTQTEIPFNPATMDVYINGDFANWWSWTAPAFGSQYQLTNNGVDTIYWTRAMTIPKGNLVALTYKYGIDTYNAPGFGFPSTDNEAGYAVNHVRYIRNSSGTYVLPLDVFGNMLVEDVVGTISMSPPSGGNVALTWNGRPGVNLQESTDMVTWTDVAGTWGASSAIRPTGSGPHFYRLVKH